MPKDELPQDLTDRIAKEENIADRKAMDKYIINPVKDAGKYLYEKVMGTEKQNEEATERMRKMDEKDPNTVQAKVNRALKKKSGGAIKMKSGGKVSSASKRADGCAMRGKTKGMMR
jgi:CO dehydrogenase/acetyl-CoA synthase beta subunit